MQTGVHQECVDYSTSTGFAKDYFILRKQLLRDCYSRDPPIGTG